MGSSFGKQPEVAHGTSVQMRVFGLGSIGLLEIPLHWSSENPQDKERSKTMDLIMILGVMGIAFGAIVIWSNS